MARNEPDLSRAAVTDKRQVKLAADLLGVDPASLERSMISRLMEIK